MVEKKVINPDKENLTKRAVVSRRLPIEFYSRNNYKKKTTKKLTKEQSELYQEKSQILHENRQKRFKKNKK